MFHGPATINVYADDVAAAVAWYTETFDVEPYFVRDLDGLPAYVEFRIGDRETEFGIIARRFEPGPGTTGARSSTGTSMPSTPPWPLCSHAGRRPTSPGSSGATTSSPRRSSTPSATCSA